MDIIKGMKDEANIIAMNLCADFFKKKITEYGNKYLYNYGRLIDQKLYFNNRRVNLTIELKGEIEALHVALSDIEVFSDAGNYYLKIGRFDIEREWIIILGQDYLQGKFGDSRINLSEKVGKTLKAVFHS